MIQPINNHILISPQVHESFLSSSREMYEEIGIVTCLQEGVTYSPAIKIGDKVFFDSYLASKYPTGKDDEFFWLVKFSDIRAIDNGQ